MKYQYRYHWRKQDFRKGGPRKFENNEDQKKKVSAQNQFISLPKIR